MSHANIKKNQVNVHRVALKQLRAIGIYSSTDFNAVLLGIAVYKSVKLLNKLRFIIANGNMIHGEHLAFMVDFCCGSVSIIA